jgi:hypothetical protein
LDPIGQRWPQLAQRRPPVARKRTVEVTLRCARGTRAKTGALLAAVAHSFAFHKQTILSAFERRDRVRSRAWDQASLFSADVDPTPLAPAARLHRAMMEMDHDWT